jgi:GTPase SAR1 family protein
MIIEVRSEAEHLRVDMYLECSALTNEGVEDVFEHALRLGFKHAQVEKLRKKNKRCIIF